MTARPALGVLCLAALAACGGGAAHIADKVPPPPTGNPEVAALNREIAMAAGQPRVKSSDYRIGPDDLLEVTLFDIESKDGIPRVVTSRVSQSGLITLPLVGAVPIGAKTPVEAEGVLREHYRRFIHEPQIAVFVKEYRAYRVSVVGYVEKPGVLEISGDRTLLEVIAMAGGLNEKAGKTVQVTRGGGDRIQTVVVDLDQLAQSGDVNLNIRMLPGDVVNVPKAGVVYVQGSVKKPGAFRLREAMTVTQALGAAGGPEEKLSSIGGLRVFRRTQSGDRQEIPVDIAAINDGQVEDLRLMENDIVVVPMSLPKYVVDKFIGGIGMGLSVPVF